MKKIKTKILNREDFLAFDNYGEATESLFHRNEKRNQMFKDEYPCVILFIKNKPIFKIHSYLHHVSIYLDKYSHLNMNDVFLNKLATLIENSNIRWYK